MLNLKYLSPPQLIGFVAGIVLTLSGSSAVGAEKIILKYGILRESISVPELTTFVETGELSSSLKSYLDMANKEPEDLQNLLTREVKVDGLLLSEFLYTAPGELLLERLSRYIHTPSKRASKQSLRAALIKSSVPDDRLTLLEILQNYPTEEAHVDGNKLADAYKQLSRLANLVPNLFE